MAAGMHVHGESEPIPELSADGDAEELIIIPEVSEDAEQRGRERRVNFLGPERQRSTSPVTVLRCDGFKMCEQQADKEMAHVVGILVPKRGA